MCQKSEQRLISMIQTLSQRLKARVIKAEPKTENKGFEVMRNLIKKLFLNSVIGLRFEYRIYSQRFIMKFNYLRILFIELN